MKLIKVLTYVALSFWIMSATAGVYKWTDANGKVHYSDKPNAKAKSTKDMKIRSTISEVDSAAAKERLDAQMGKQEMNAESRRQQANTKAQTKPQNKGVSISCGTSRKRLNDLKNNSIRKFTFDPETGERRWMTDKDIESEVAKHQANVNIKCK